MNREQFYALLGKGADIGSRGASQQMEKQAALEQLIKGKNMDADSKRSQAVFEDDLKGKRQDKNLQTAKGLQGELGPNYKVSVSDSGVSFGETPKDPLAAWFKTQAHETKKKNDLDGAVTKLGERVSRDDIPGAVSQLRQSEQDLPQPGQGFKSVGGLKNFVPTMLTGPAEWAGILDKGATAERGALESLKALTRKPIFGTSLTATEKSSADAAFGAGIGTEEADVRRAIERMRSIPATALQNIEASSRPDAVDTYRTQGGINSAELAERKPPSQHMQSPQAPGTADAAAPKLGFEEFKRLKREGKL